MERRRAKDLLSVDEVADYLSVRPTTVYQWCREGRLPALKLGKVWRIRRDALDALLQQSENDTTLVAQLRAFLRVPDHIIAIAPTTALLHRLDAAFFQAGEAAGACLVKFLTGGEHDSVAVLRAAFEVHGLGVKRLEEKGQMRFSSENLDPKGGRPQAVEELLRDESKAGHVIWACFNWTDDVNLETALKQQEELARVIKGAPLVVQTSVLERVADDWPMAQVRRAQTTHSGTVWLSEAGLVLSRVAPFPPM